ncbi:MAG TPA: peptidylprolyl isomerase [Gemmatales bacterium]|nr:peptidylprolyl isomerase [Gemmatales bacterium]
MRAWLGSLVPVCLMLGVGSAWGQMPPPGKPAAVVNGEALTADNWAAALKRLPPFPPDVDEASKKSVHFELLGMLLDDMLLRQHLSKHAPAVSKTQVDQRVAELEASLKAKTQTLADFLKETHQTDEQLRGAIGLELQWQAYVNQRSAQVDLKTYWEQNRDLFDGVLVRVCHISVPLQPGAADKDVQQAVARLQAVRQEVARGLDFTEAMRRFGQDESAPRSAGDLGYFPPRKADTDPFIRTASNLKVNEMSDVVRTDFGVHLIKVTERKPGTPSKYEEIKDAVKAVWADELRISLILDLRKSAKIEVNLP